MRIEPAVESVINVVCMLRSGRQYGPQDVVRLKRSVEQHLPLPHRFVCFSDINVPGIERIPLVHDWPKWWPKLEYFRKNVLAGLVIGLDLDTLVVGSLTDLACLNVAFAGLNDFYDVHLNRPLVKLASGVLVWTPPNGHDLYDAMARDDTHIQLNPGRRMDLFVGPRMPHAKRLQKLLPGQIVSFKIHCKHRPDPPPNARIICFHGSPGIRDLPVNHWARQRWERAA